MNKINTSFEVPINPVFLYFKSTNWSALVLVWLCMGGMSGCTVNHYLHHRPKANNDNMLKMSEQLNLLTLPTSEQVEQISRLVNQSISSTTASASPIEPLPELAKETIASFILASSCHRSIRHEPATLAQRYIDVKASGNFEGYLTDLPVSQALKCVTIDSIQANHSTTDVGVIQFKVAYTLNHQDSEKDRIPVERRYQMKKIHDQWKLIAAE